MIKAILLSLAVLLAACAPAADKMDSVPVLTP